MAALPHDGKMTITQKLGPLVEWYIADKAVDLKFIPNPKLNGLIAPEFDFEWWVDGRRIQIRTLAMMCMSDLQARNFNYNLAKIMAALVDQAWKYYIGNIDYAPWLASTTAPVVKNPNGRPRKHPKKIPFDEIIVNGRLVEPGISNENNNSLRNQDS